MVATHNGNSFYTNYENTVEQSWYADSGATNHVISNYNNLTNPMEYGGNELVIVGNGNTLQIASVGNPMLTNGKYSLNLNIILHVSYIAKTLVSVSKLAKDNNVFIEFHDNYCLVKD